VRSGQAAWQGRSDRVKQVRSHFCVFCGAPRIWGHCLETVLFDQLLVIWALHNSKWNQSWFLKVNDWKEGMNGTRCIKKLNTPILYFIPISNELLWLVDLETSTVSLSSQKCVFCCA